MDAMEFLSRMLERTGPPSESDRHAAEAAGLATRRVEADQDLARAGGRASHMVVLLDGLACRYKALEDGRRQITAFHVPGELCDLAGLFLGKVDHGTCTLTPAEVVLVPHAALLGWRKRHPRLNDALWRAALVDTAVSREWIVNVGRRTAYARTAHLLCELALRLRVAGLADGPACGFPLTQSVLADALGLTPVHVNRTLQQLRADGLAEVGGGTLAVRNWRGLKQAGGFDAGYLHQTGTAA